MIKSKRDRPGADYRTLKGTRDAHLVHQKAVSLSAFPAPRLNRRDRVLEGLRTEMKWGRVRHLLRQAWLVPAAKSRGMRAVVVVGILAEMQNRPALLGFYEDKSPRDVPLPRYPHFINATASNWYRTTVNPIVWARVPKVVFPIDVEFMVCWLRIARNEGLEIDWPWAQPLYDIEKGEIENRVIGRPDALLDPNVLRQLFGLMTSGRKSDHDRAKKALLALLAAPRGEATTHEPLGSGVVDTFVPPPVQKRSGREVLAEILAVQLQAWRAFEEAPSMGDSEVSKTTGISRSRLRGYRKDLADYRQRLESSQWLRDAAEATYPGQGIDAVVLASLEDALRWLQAPPSGGAQRQSAEPPNANRGCEP